MGLAMLLIFIPVTDLQKVHFFFASMIFYDRNIYSNGYIYFAWNFHSIVIESIWN